ncbi:MAG: hypothetical protein A3E01_08340 [Gammaproteobacteria bacterium RIFCSPHIGHO2_12_FULL_63_22]|nr:MAG: hypothetical protein A3E01_08340 [Gammaproteobacteria bacterium RIFCSPHIGHO2_12_FULL_63_22]
MTLIGLRRLPAWFQYFLIAIVIGVLGALVFASRGFAAPKAQSAEECVVFADMALVASTHARHGISKAQTMAMVPDIYGALLQSRGDDGQKLAVQIVGLAYRQAETDRKTSPSDFASVLAAMCVQLRGDMDPLFGIES